MLVFIFVSFSVLARADDWFPSDYPPNSTEHIQATMRQYLQNKIPVINRPTHTRDGRLNILKAYGAATGLVVGLELNHARLSVDNQRATLFAIGALLLRALIDQTGQAVPNDGSFPLGQRSAFWRPVGDDRMVRRELARLLEPAPRSAVGRFGAATLLHAIADGDFLPLLTEDAARYRDEAVETIRRILLRQAPFRHVVIDAAEAARALGVLTKLGGPRIAAINEAVACHQGLGAPGAQDD